MQNREINHLCTILSKSSHKARNKSHAKSRPADDSPTHICPVRPTAPSTGHASCDIPRAGCALPGTGLALLMDGERTRRLIQVPLALLDARVPQQGVDQVGERKPARVRPVILQDGIPVTTCLTGDKEKRNSSRNFGRSHSGLGASGSFQLRRS